MSEKFNLVAFRDQRGLTQKELGEALGVHRKYISMIETGVKPLSEKLKKKLKQLQVEKVTLPSAAGCPRCLVLETELRVARAVIRDQASALAAAMANFTPPLNGKHHE